MTAVKYQKKILIVEDNHIQRLLIKKHVESWNYEILEAANGQEALDIITTDNSIGIILLDIMMPQMSGIEFLKLSRYIRSEKKIKVCMTTALRSEKDVRECLKHAADDYIMKPIDFTILKDKIHLFIDNRYNAGIVSIKNYFHAKAIRDGHEVNIMVTHLSKLDIHFESPMDLKVGETIKIKAGQINDIIGEREDIRLRIYNSLYDGVAFFQIYAVFVGLRDSELQSLNSFAKLGKGLFDCS